VSTPSVIVTEYSTAQLSAGWPGLPKSLGQMKVMFFTIA